MKVFYYYINMQKFLCVLNRMCSLLAMVSPVVDEKDLHFVIVDIMDKNFC